MYTKNKIEQYEKMLSNIEWHIETNGWSINENDMKHFKTRARDYKEFIGVLKTILYNEPKRDNHLFISSN